MKLQHTQTMAQKLVLSPAMRQSLECLQLPIVSLQEYVQETSLSNPVLEVSVPDITAAATEEGAIEYREQSFWHARTSEEEGDALSLMTREETFCDYLYGQIGQMALIDDHLRPLCTYLVGCLDRRGYLDCPLDELAAEYGCHVSLMEQALYAVQMLDPPGTGARDLKECLILQLMQGKSFNALTLGIVKDGLDLLAAGDLDALAGRFHATADEVRRAANAIRALSPIPSRGFPGGEMTSYTVPEAVIACHEGTLRVSMNSHLLPQVGVSEEYRRMMRETTDQEVKQYLKQKFSEADTLVEHLHSRSRTLSAILTAVVQVQRSFFLEGVLQPLTMQDLARDLGLSTSTVSRAVQDKAVQFEGQIVPLRSLFTTPVRASDGSAASSQAIKQQLQGFLRAEDPSAPLSDEALQSALETVGIRISRRTVAKYRGELGFAIASRRKRK